MKNPFLVQSEVKRLALSATANERKLKQLPD